MKPKPIDCLLGADIYKKIMLEGMKMGPDDAPMAQNSRLGWILLGLTPPPDRDYLETNVNLCINSFFTQQEDSISKALVQMWNLDQIPKKAFLTPEEEECEKHFVDTVYRVEGRFGVRLPFKTKPYFPGSRQIAISSLKRLQARLAKNLNLKSSYIKFMQEYLDLGHMEEIPKDEIDRSDVYYIPHHPVVNKGKLRVVFNASAPAFNHLSLNKTLHTGQKLQQNIVNVLIRWRCFRVAFTCDIVKMFRQILIDPRDRDWLRIVFDFGAGILHFRACTVTYGTVPAPFQSLRVLLEIAKDCGDRTVTRSMLGSVLELLQSENPPEVSEVVTALLALDAESQGALLEVSEIIRENCYVDDFFSGADTLNHAITKRNGLITVLKSAGIELSKWAANDIGLLNGLVDIEQNDKTVELNEVTSALGLKWSPLSDKFSFIFDPQYKHKDVVTKRVVLSEASKLFDPLGWVSPILVCFKIFMQDLWIDGLDWDTALSPELRNTWKSVKGGLKSIDSIEFPRWLGVVSDTSWSHHGFADASKRAYAACLYLVPETGSPALICSKTKVAPVNTISITKLELSAAQLLTHLIDSVLPALHPKPKQIHCWSDSRNVLC